MQEHPDLLHVLVVQLLLTEYEPLAVVVPPEQETFEAPADPLPQELNPVEEEQLDTVDELDEVLYVQLYS